MYPAERINALLDAHGCNSQRIRSFPAVAGAYYCMALSLYPEAAYEEVFAVIAQGLARRMSSPRYRCKSPNPPSANYAANLAMRLCVISCIKLRSPPQRSHPKPSTLDDACQLWMAISRCPMKWITSSNSATRAAARAMPGTRRRSARY
ncbi:MAG: transposase domain-containing protein [Uliginosibacterium sp.]|nr:transposase domain-containing protein [Uliginosibacterium sp.]